MQAPKAEKLGDIAQIFNGVLESVDAKEFPSDSQFFRYELIQPTHLGLFNNIHNSSVTARSSPLPPDYFLHKNDILVKRLNPDIVVLAEKDLPHTTFSGNLFVIRVSSDHYCPAYLACLLENQGFSGRTGNIVGSIAAIKSISAKSLAGLIIPFAEYEKQKLIGEIWLLSKKRRKLLSQLIEEDRRLIAGMLKKDQPSYRTNK